MANPGESVYWASLPERGGVANDIVYNSMLDVAMTAGRAGFQRLSIGYARTDYARNEIVRVFVDQSKRDNDLLVMLDADHKHPADILTRFAAHDPALGITGALAYRRGEPYDPLFFMRDDARGGLFAPAQFERGPMYRCAIVSTSAIAIRRWVLLELERKGYVWPYFRYEYPTGKQLPSEDMYFGRICEQAGLWHHCDTSLEIPHLRWEWVDGAAHEGYLAAHPDLIGVSMKVGAVE